MRQLSRLGVQPRARSARPNILRYSCQGDEIEARQGRIVDMVGPQSLEHQGAQPVIARREPIGGKRSTLGRSGTLLRGT